METLKKRYSRMYAYDLLDKYMYTDDETLSVEDYELYKKFYHYQHGLVIHKYSPIDCVRFVNRYLGKVVY